MKIQLITRHFWPDSTPGARLHRAIFEHLASQGHEIRVIAGPPTYHDLNHEAVAKEEVKAGVFIKRVSLIPERRRWLALRIFNAIYFYCRAFVHTWRHPSDLLVVSSYPPVLPGLCAWLLNRLTGIPYLYHCLDIQPEASALVGKLKNDRVLKLLKRIDRRTCQSAVAVVTLSEAMADTLKARGFRGDTIRLINNFHTEPLKPPSTAKRGPAVAHRSSSSSRKMRLSFEESFRSENIVPFEGERDFQVTFAGNMGSFQGLDLLVDAAKVLRNRPEIKFVFMGAGEKKRELVEQAGELNGNTIHFIPFQPMESASTVVAGSDLAVISLLPAVFSTAVPSKTMMYLRAGCPLLALIEPECELAQLIQRESIGYVPKSREAEAVAEVIAEVADRPQRVSQAERKRLTQVGESLYGYESTLEKWTLLINRLDAATPSRHARKESRRAA